MYKQYLGLISRDDLFWIEATTLMPSPENKAVFYVKKKSKWIIF